MLLPGSPEGGHTGTMLVFGLIGAGFIGRLHAENLAGHPEVDLRCVADIDLDAAKEVAEKYGVNAVGDTASVFNDLRIDAVLIASDARTHGELITSAANAGKAIFCEKPIDTDLHRAETSVREVDASGVPFQIGFNRRFDPTHEAVYDAVRSGGVGSVEMVVITSRDPEPPPMDYLVKSPGCLWHDNMIHDFDMARWMLGEEPTEIFATASCLVDPEIGRRGEVDTAMVVLKTAGGALCHINASMRAAYGHDQRVEVFGSKGMAASNNVRPTAVETWTKDGARRDNPPYFFLDRYPDSYRRELAHFIEAVEKGRPTRTGTHDGLQALVLSFAARESHGAGAPLKVSELGRGKA